ncbi:MAG: chromosomal replication initiator protein DnaA [Christensenellales bacterium]|jgi:chromosomal replication initiator protein
MADNATIERQWKSALERIHAMIPPHSYDTWFRQLEPIGITGNSFLVRCDNSVTAMTLKSRYYSILSGSVKEAFGREYEIEIVDKSQEALDSAKSNHSALTTPLNAKYTFDSFVVGSSNRFAHAAARAVAEMPSKAYNPFFLYGGVGLGKTHLMHAIGHFVSNENPAAKILYITSENFTNELIEAIAHHTNQEFREKLRGVDILMVDDIQFISGKDSTQEEFFHTFNHLHSLGRQIIISSDCPPKDIPRLEERLRSRFEWGLIADIQKPDYETRCAILREKAQRDNIDVPDEVIHYIGANVESNIRELEGFLTRVTANALLEQRPITKSLAERTLTGVMGVKEPKKLTVDLIIDAVSQKFGVDKELIVSNRRNREITRPRQICMYLVRELMNLSTPRIGDAFGGRDHTTVLHACDKVAQYMRDNPLLASEIEEIKNDIGK